MIEKSIQMMENSWLENVNFKEINCKDSCAYMSKAEGQVVVQTASLFLYSEGNLNQSKVWSASIFSINTKEVRTQK